MDYSVKVMVCANELSAHVLLSLIKFQNEYTDLSQQINGHSLSTGFIFSYLSRTGLSQCKHPFIVHRSMSVCVCVYIRVWFVYEVYEENKTSFAF